MVTSLKPELSKLLASHDFASFIPSELKELPSKITTLAGEIQELKRHVHGMEIDLHGDINDIPTKLETFTSTVSSLMFQVAEMKTLKWVLLYQAKFCLQALWRMHPTLLQARVFLQQAQQLLHLLRGRRTPILHNELVDLLGIDIVTQYYNKKLLYDKYYDKMLKRRKISKIINCDVLTQKGPITQQVYREDGTTEVIPNVKVSDLHLAEWKEFDFNKPLKEQDPLNELNDLANKKRKRTGDLKDHSRSTKKHKSSVQHEEEVLRMLGSIFTLVYAMDQKLKKANKVYKAGKRLLYVKRNKAISLGKDTDEVFRIWKTFGRITRDLGSFREETDKTTDLHQHLSRMSLQWLETASQIQRDAATTKIKTTSQYLMTVSQYGYSSVGRFDVFFRNQLLVFQQHQDESLYDSWTRFKDIIRKVPNHGLSIWTLIEIFLKHLDSLSRHIINLTAEGDLRKFSDIGAWVQVPRCMAWLDYDEHVDSLSTMDNEVGVTSPKSTTQTLPSFEEYTPPVTYPEEVEKTLGTPIEEMFDNDWGFEFKEVSHLGEELRPNEVEKGRILEAHRLEPILQQQLSQRMAPSHHDVVFVFDYMLYLMRRSLEVLRKFHWMILGGRFNQLSHVSSPLLSKPGEY
ncbi:hypothetical protein Tco_1274079 [Tanacetum coccineum]